MGRSRKRCLRPGERVNFARAKEEGREREKREGGEEEEERKERGRRAITHLEAGKTVGVL